MSSKSQHTLVIKDVYKSFGKKEVLKEVNMECQQNSIFGLIGLNGVGKTTLIKSLIGLQRPNSGSLEIFGIDSQKPEAREKFAYLPEKFTPSPYFSGHEFLRLSLSYYGKKYSISDAEAYAERLGLEASALKQKMTKYSKGMTQKIGLISAFLTDVPLLILDEPMSGLDPKMRIQLKNLLLEEKEKGKTIFFSSHILSDIDSLCDRIAIIDQQRIAYTGTTSAFKKQMKTDVLEDAFLKLIEKAAA